MSIDYGKTLTGRMIHVALAFWFVALLLQIWLGSQGRSARTIPGMLARHLWSAGLLAYLIHVALAFHFYHHWSHAEAVRHVEYRSGFGPGIAFSHLFTLAWALDVAWWWLHPTTRAARPPWITWVLLGYMGFIVFNATVVYETGTIRHAGIAATVVIAAAVVSRLLSSRT